MILAETYGQLMGDPAHWLFEISLEIITAPVFFLLGWWWRNSLVKHFHRDLRREHARLDAEHGITLDMHDNPAYTVIIPNEQES